MKKKKMEFGHLAGAMSGMDPIAMRGSSKPALNVSVRMEGTYPEDSSWRKKEAIRLKKEIKATEKMIADWDAEDVAKRAMNSLKTDLAVKRARLMESEALAGDVEEDEEA